MGAWQVNGLQDWRNYLYESIEQMWGRGFSEVTVLGLPLALCKSVYTCCRACLGLCCGSQRPPTPLSLLKAGLGATQCGKRLETGCRLQAKASDVRNVSKSTNHHFQLSYFWFTFASNTNRCSLYCVLQRNILPPFLVFVFKFVVAGH